MKFVTLIFLLLLINIPNSHSQYEFELGIKNIKNFSFELVNIQLDSLFPNYEKKFIDIELETIREIMNEQTVDTVLNSYDFIFHKNKYSLIIKSVYSNSSSQIEYIKSFFMDEKNAISYIMTNFSNDKDLERIYEHYNNYKYFYNDVDNMILIIANSFVGTRKECLYQLIDFDNQKVFNFISWGFNPNIVRVNGSKCLITPIKVEIDRYENVNIKVIYESISINI